MTPTNSEKLEALAHQCEQATGPDRALDAEIELAAIEGQEGATHDENCAGWLRHSRWQFGCKKAAAYTDSVDAALSLVPEGWERIQQEQVRMSDGLRCWASIDGYPASPKTCATPALALCAAALRTRIEPKE